MGRKDTPHILRDIRTYCNDLISEHDPKLDRTRMFISSTYTDPNDRERHLLSHLKSHRCPGRHMYRITVWKMLTLLTGSTSVLTSNEDGIGKTSIRLPLTIQVMLRFKYTPTAFLQVYFYNIGLPNLRQSEDSSTMSRPPEQHLRATSGDP
jgi:hypothetical protein